MLILKTIVHETIWGGSKLTPYSGSASTRIGHLYSLISNGEFESEILNGPYAGKLFRHYFEENKARLHLAQYAEFPFLLALVDAADDLSLQVHPNDHAAQQLEHVKRGKNESWYFLHAPQSGRIFNGCRAANSEELAQKVAQGKYDDIIDELPVKPGDYVYVQAGTLHAMSAGSLVYEIEENCNATYRVYDFDRVDKSGQKRPLHTQKALASIDVSLKSQAVPYEGEKCERLYATQLFTQQTSYQNNTHTLVCLTFLSGENVLEGFPVRCGVTVVLEPAERITFAPADFVMSRPLVEEEICKTN